MAGPDRKKMRRRLGVLLLFVTFCAVALLLFEVGVRLLEPQPEEPYRYSPHTYYEPVPGADYVYRRSEFRVPVRFNRHGMRDKPRSLEKAADVLRIALLGDSFAEALQVPQDSMLSQRLERQLQGCIPGRPTEVLNFGVSGYGTVAVAARYATLARGFGPDLVVYLFVRNDPWDVVQQETRLYEIRDGTLVVQPLQPGKVSRVLRPVADFSKHHFHAYRFLKYRFLRLTQGSQRATAEKEAVLAGDGEIVAGETAWQRTRMALELLQEMVEADGVALVVAQATTAGPKMDAEISGLCADLGLPFLTVVPELEAAPGAVFYEIDGHWRSEGHEVASRTLAPWLCSLLHNRRGMERIGSPPGTLRGESDL